MYTSIQRVFAVFSENPLNADNWVMEILLRIFFHCALRQPKKPEIGADLMDHLARMQTSPFLPTTAHHAYRCSANSRRLTGCLLTKGEEVL